MGSPIRKCKDCGAEREDMDDVCCPKCKPRKTRMTRLEEIEARCNAATDGPWEDHNWDKMERPHVVAHKLWNGVDHCNGHFDVPCTFENTSFIAHSRQDIPYLISEIRKRDRALEVAKEALGFYANDDLYWDHREGQPGTFEFFESTIACDEGRTANEALAEIEKVMGEKC